MDDKGGFEVVETALRADPSLAEVEHVATFAEPQRWLFQVRWGSKAEIPSVLTTAETNMPSAQTKSVAWELRLFVSDRQHLSQSYEACDANDFEIKSIRELCGDDIIAGTNLTLRQYQALITAYQLGYYDVPRQVSTTKIAEVLGISHQALSERLSRGHRNLIRSILQYDDPLATSTGVVRCLKSE